MRLDIQGLRALAVSLVVLSHAGVSVVGGGYVGVDVFFVISGFLITSLLSRELRATGGISVRKFYARRALRLLPASTLVVVTTLGGAWLFLSKIRFADYVGDALSSALYAVNLRLAINGTDYLAQGSPPSPFQHFWSLAVEEQFYLLWPLLLLLSWKLARRRALLVAPLVALCLVSFGLSVSVTESSPPWAYFGPHTRVWELGVGSLLALFVARLEQLPPTLSAPMTWTGLACVVLSALRFDQDTPFPGYHALLPVVGAALLLAGGCSPARFGAGRLLSRQPLVWLGGLSYGWYLWHWPLLLIGPIALGRPATVRLALVLSAIALLLAWATVHLVENPVRFHTAFRGRHGRALGLGLGLSVGAAVLSLIAAAFPPAIDSGAPAPTLKGTLATAPDAKSRLTELLDASETRLPSNLAPALTKIKDAKSAIYRDGCHVNYASTRTPTCVYGSRSADKVVVLFGDSHAAQWFPALNRLAQAHRWKLVSLTKASCKVAAVTIIQGGKPYVSCDAWRSRALAKIKDLRPSLVIVSSSDAGDPAQPMSNPLQGWTAGFRDTFRTLAGTGAQVAAILDTPWPKGDAVDCAALHPLRLGRCTNHVPQAIRDQTRTDAIKEAARSTHTAVIDPEPWLCTREGTCPVVVGDTFVYRDDSHMAEAYAEAIAPVVGDRLSELFGTDLERTGLR
ncbi:acyltransferase family protein [Streptomyces albiflavescens]|uniref:acyltransferase family protein n=1 Tax=Streptomyces albiflavescens TaxID=1623582 RepID=UPI001E33B32C|nr:acyltransferase family protein [Streptomyces albiflavescens]